ncbi:MAG: polysaccharide biosynthesis/export family protein [Myxococcota bacterium]
MRASRGAFVIPFLVAGCASGYPYVWATDLPPAETDGRLRPSDAVTVQVTGQESLSGDLKVRRDGTILMPVVGPVQVEGKTSIQVQKLLIKKLDGIVIEPRVTVSMSQTRLLKVGIIGEVRSPGTYEISGVDNILAVLAQAGGLTEFADRSGIYVVRSGAGKRVRFRYEDLTGGEVKSLDFELRDGDTLVVE